MEQLLFIVGYGNRGENVVVVYVVPSAADAKMPAAAGCYREVRQKNGPSCFFLNYGYLPPAFLRNWRGSVSAIAAFMEKQVVSYQQFRRFGKAEGAPAYGNGFKKKIVAVRGVFQMKRNGPFSDEWRRRKKRDGVNGNNI